MVVATDKIADLLEQSIGLTVTSIGVSTFKRALNNRKKVLGIDDDGAYLEKLTVSFMELRRLVEEVVVPETWFFRDQEPFIYLTDYAKNTPKDLSVDIFRILSLPCSTGEEPYSIAMTLLQSGFKPTSFYIDAVDVSGRSLALARKGVYRKNSFRTKEISFRDNFFHETEEGYSLSNTVKEKVRFLHGNILQPGFLESLGLYDVVFCRNLLIYFNKESQQKAIKGLYDALVPDGLMFTGHSEASLFVGDMFDPVTYSRAFAFRKKEISQDPPPLRVKTGKRNYSKLSQQVTSTPYEFKRSGSVSKNISHDRQPKNEDDISYVQQLANEGNLEEAAGLCEKILRKNGPSADWYYLLGVIRESQNQPDEAIKFFRKAVYLDPDNVDSLTQLALLAEKTGNTDSAENYRRRARRIHEKG